jgi:HTH-type transcriptional regulator / antitoxin HigA
MSTKRIPDTNALLQAWIPFKTLAGVTSVHTEDDYEQAQKLLSVLIDEIRDDENHPLIDFVDYLAEQIKAYEDDNFTIPTSEPCEILKFLMDQHNLNQTDLSDCIAQSHISAILAGRRSISKETAKKLAKRFNVRADLFI